MERVEKSRYDWRYLKGIKDKMWGVFFFFEFVFIIWEFCVLYIERRVEN